MLRFVTALFMISCLIGNISTRGTTQTPGQCLAQVLCTNQEIITWTTDGRRCIVLLNPCWLRTANCARKRRKEPLLRVVPRPQCQRLCPAICTLQFEPVCAEYRGQRRLFGNRCQLDVHVCQTGQLYQFLHPGDC